MLLQAHTRSTSVQRRKACCHIKMVNESDFISMSDLSDKQRESTEQSKQRNLYIRIALHSFSVFEIYKFIDRRQKNDDYNKIFL